MGEYLDIKTSVTDILGAASNLVTIGAAMESEMAGLIDAIERLEHAGTWGADDFAKAFLDGYHRPLENGMLAADAVKALGHSKRGSGDGPRSVGQTTQDLGNMVVNAMLNYTDTDTGNAAGIKAAGVED